MVGVLRGFSAWRKTGLFGLGRRQKRVRKVPAGGIVWGVRQASRIALLAGAMMLAAACSSTKPRVSPKDGAADSASGGHGGLGAGGTVTGTLASGGRVGTSGGSAGGGSSGGGGNPGTGGTSLDAAQADLAHDQAGGQETPAAVEAGAGCGPGYPVGGSRPQGDGCNTCYCQSGGTWSCTSKVCLPPVDGGTDAPADVALPPNDAGQDIAAGESGAAGCVQLGSQEQCQARADCHAVFFDPGGCDCATLGCCAGFRRCAEGPAMCSGYPFCTQVAPHCEGPYVVSYTSACYEGCVLASACPHQVGSER